MANDGGVRRRRAVVTHGRADIAESGNGGNAGRGAGLLVNRYRSHMSGVIKRATRPKGNASYARRST